MMSTLRRRLLVVAGLILGFLFFGTIGFVVVEDYPVFDAFYMSLITMTTVGYMEVRPLSTTGRIYNSFLMLFGVGTMFYAIGAVTQTIIEVQFGDALQKRRVRRMIEKLSEHYLVCGYGRVGRAAAAEMQRSNLPFVILDRNPEKVERAMKAGMLALLADSTRDEMLIEAGVQRARGLIAALSTDADNLFLILSAKNLNPLMKVASRVAEEASEAKMRLAGADAVYMPYSITGYRLAQSILRPFVFEFLDITATTSSMGLNVGIEQVAVNKGSALAGKSLRDLQLKRDLGIIVLAIRRANARMEFNPQADSVIDAGDHLIVMGGVDEVSKLCRLTSGGVRA
jgi:voltage-gated potassium channel